MNKNQPYVRKNDENGECIDSFPYISGISNRHIRRGNERIAEVAGQFVRQRRVKSAKRKKDWI